MGLSFTAPAGTYTAPAKLGTKSITDNGTYDPADDGLNGYSEVTVNVSGGGTSVITIIPEQTVTITDSPVALTGVDASSLSNDDEVLMRVEMAQPTVSPSTMDVFGIGIYNSAFGGFSITNYTYWFEVYVDIVNDRWLFNVADENYDIVGGTYKVLAVKNTVINFSE